VSKQIDACLILAPTTHLVPYYGSGDSHTFEILRGSTITQYNPGVPTLNETIRTVPCEQGSERTLGRRFALNEQPSLKT
jgi:hypothetical protein